MKKNFEVNVYWFVNHIVHNYHKMIFIESHQELSGEWQDNFICEWGDYYYYTHKGEIHSRIVDFISVDKKEIIVYLKETDNDK